MFGYPCAFVGGNMFAGLHEERLVVRLAEDAREELRAIAGAKVFEPMKGRPMAEYTVVPPAMHGRLADLRKWLKRALDYGASLPAKATKKAGAKKTTAKKTAAKKTAPKKSAAKRTAAKKR